MTDNTARSAQRVVETLSAYGIATTDMTRTLERETSLAAPLERVAGKTGDVERHGHDARSAGVRRAAAGAQA